MSRTIAGGLSVDGQLGVVANLSLATGFLGSDPNLLSMCVCRNLSHLHLKRRTD